MPRPVNPTFIVPPNEVLDEQIVCDMNIPSLFRLRNFVGTGKWQAIQWASRHGLLSNTMRRCNADRDSQLMMGRRCIARSAEIRRTIASSLIPNWKMCQILVILWCWAKDVPPKDASHNAKYNCDVCERYLEEHPSEVGGLDENGDPIIVEIDESKFFHRKIPSWAMATWTLGLRWRRTSVKEILPCRG